MLFGAPPEGFPHIQNLTSLEKHAGASLNAMATPRSADDGFQKTPQVSINSSSSSLSPRNPLTDLELTTSSSFSHPMPAILHSVDEVSLIPMRWQAMIIKRFLQLSQEPIVRDKFYDHFTFALSVSPLIFQLTYFDLFCYTSHQ